MRDLYDFKLLFLRHTVQGSGEPFLIRSVSVSSRTSQEIKFFIGLHIGPANNQPICGVDDVQSDSLINKQKAMQEAREFIYPSS